MKTKERKAKGSKAKGKKVAIRDLKPTKAAAVKGGSSLSSTRKIVDVIFS